MTVRQVEALVAELAPQPDVPSSVRKLPDRVGSSPAAQPALDLSSASTAASPAEPQVTMLAPVSRPIVRAPSPKRYRVEFTIGEETHGRLRRLQDLLRREIPSGDPAEIFDRAIRLLLDRVETRKIGAPVERQRRPAIRPGTDTPSGTPLDPRWRTAILLSRYIPRPVSRGAWDRDGGRCAFVAENGRRCSERAYIDRHHQDPHAKGGPATLPNISLHCRRHNEYEAELVFGPRRPAKPS